MKDNEGCFIIIGIVFILFIISGIRALMENFPLIMLCIILGIILIVVIIYKISQYRQEELYRQQQIEKERQAKIEKEWLARLEREKREKQRLEELKYESVTVVFAYIEEDGKPNAIIKRSNNTYEFLERDSNSPYTIGETLKFSRKVTNTWNWVNEQEYQKRRAIKEGRAKQLQQQKEREREEAERKRLEAEQQELKRLYATYKIDWRDFQRVLQEKGITKLYHFTDRANLQSIKQNDGIFSWDYCQRNKITISRPGGSPLSWNLDRLKGLQNYVRLSFVRDHPMLYVAKNDGRIINPVILEISTDVIFKKETKFATRNAAKGGVMADTSFEKFNAIKFPIFKKRYFDLNEEEKPFYQAEVLVLEKVPSEFILNIDGFIDVSVFDDLPF
jgi:hypothetical protein